MEYQTGCRFLKFRGLTGLSATFLRVADFPGKEWIHYTWWCS